MGKTIHKDVFRQIKGSIGRFVSLVLIVILGVAIYAGVRSSCPNMKLSADALYDKSNLADIKVMSSLGITDDDIEALSNVDGVEKVCGSYTYDFLNKTDGTLYVVQAKSLTTGINEVNIETGRAPENKNECLIYESFQKLAEYEIGDLITLTSGDGKDLKDIISKDTFTIVGTFSTPEYMGTTLGSSSIGAGTLDGIIMVIPQVFVLETYTEANVVCSGTKELNSYSDEYDARVAQVQTDIEAIADVQVEKRYNDIIDDAREELDKARKEFEDGKAKWEEGKAQWEDGKRQLEDAKAQYLSGVTQVQDGLKEIETNRKELEANKKLLSQKWVEFYEGEEELNEGMQEFLIQKAEAEAEIAKQEAQMAEVEEKIKFIVGPNRLERIRAVIKAVTGLDTPYEAYKAYVEEKIAEARAQLADAQAQLDAAYAQLEEGRAQLNEAQAQLDAGEAQLNQGYVQLLDAQQQLGSAKIEIESGEKTLQENYKKIQDGEEELKDAEKKLDDAEKEISKLEHGEWYVLDRSYLVDFSAYGGNADQIGNIGKVIPLVFFIVAALVCLTSMTRMVDEERTQIGTLKAIGYGKMMIMRKYVVYALLATILGTVIGVLAGSKFLLWFIMKEIRMIYPGLKEILIPYNAEHSLVASIAALVCIIGATIIACVKALLEVPASLMRPLTPKASKKILLERIPALWNKIPFTWKNAFRNFVRYKKRLLMTLIGICGSTAIMLLGFGLKDAVGEILETQYRDICIYDEIITLDPNITDRNRIELEKNYRQMSV